MHGQLLGPSDTKLRLTLYNSSVEYESERADHLPPSKKDWGKGFMSRVHAGREACN